jgi:peroxiredoxin family protein/TusA-related sulfurtransferase
MKAHPHIKKVGLFYGVAMLSEEDLLQTIDCRGMQGPVLFAEITKAIRKQAILPAKLKILATDENFPTEIEGWSTLSKHRIEGISKGEDGVYSARLIIEHTPISTSNRPSRVNLVTVAARPAPPIPTPEPASTKPLTPGGPVDINASALRIEDAPTKDSKPEIVPIPEKKVPAQAGPALKESPKPDPIKSSPFPTNSKLGVYLTPPFPQKSSANISLPPLPRSNARIDLSALSKMTSQNNLPIAPKNLARIDIPKELLSTSEDDLKEKPAATLPQDSTRIEAPRQTSSKLQAIVPPESDVNETDPRKEDSVAEPLPQDSTRIEIPPKKNSAPQKHEQEEDQESRESRTETGVRLSDLSGLTSARALLQLSTLILQVGDGPLQLIADAPNFEERLRAWARLTGIFIQELQNTDGRINALLLLGQTPVPIHQTQPVPTITAKPQENRGSLCITKNSPESLFAAMMLANAAATKGAHIEILFYSFGVELLRATPPAENPIKKLFQRIFAWFSTKKQRLHQLDFQGSLSQSLGYQLPNNKAPSVVNMLQTANPQRIKFLVCRTSLGLVGLSPTAMIQGPTLEVTDLSTFTEAVGQGGFHFTF